MPALPSPPSSMSRISPMSVATTGLPCAMNSRSTSGIEFADEGARQQSRISDGDVVLQIVDLPEVNHAGRPAGTLQQMRLRVRRRSGELDVPPGGVEPLDGLDSGRANLCSRWPGWRGKGRSCRI